jgi:MFS family permease
MKFLPKGLARTRLACYSTYPAAASVFCLPSLLFVTFHELYGISYTLLGTLIAVNFFTQLLVDLLCTVLSKKHHVERMLRSIPIMTTAGMLIYALVPLFFPHIAYLGLLIGTVVFSVAAGLSEVLLSPTVAAIPSERPQSDMSLLHSLYGFGVCAAVLISSAALHFVGTERWYIVMLAFSALPLITAFLFMTSPIPDIKVGSETKAVGKRSKERAKGLALCILCIFFGGCAENTMTNWISSYAESALRIPKVVGDVCGVALFALLLALARAGFAAIGKSIRPVLLVGMIACSVCYLTAGLMPGTVIPFIASILIGLFSAMLWPGTLILMEENVSDPGVAGFAMLAAAGDLGASLAPQLTGIVVDTVSAAPFAERLAASLSVSTDAIGLRAGMLVTAIFPLLGTVAVILALRFFKKPKNMTSSL